MVFENTKDPYLSKPNACNTIKEKGLFGVIFNFWRWPIDFLWLRIYKIPKYTFLTQLDIDCMQLHLLLFTFPFKVLLAAVKYVSNTKKHTVSVNIPACTTYNKCSE